MFHRGRTIGHKRHKEKVWPTRYRTGYTKCPRAPSPLSSVLLLHRLMLLDAGVLARHIPYDYPTFLPFIIPSIGVPVPAPLPRLTIAMSPPLLLRLPSLSPSPSSSPPSIPRSPHHSCPSSIDLYLPSQMPSTFPHPQLLYCHVQQTLSLHCLNRNNIVGVRPHQTMT